MWQIKTAVHVSLGIAGKQQLFRNWCLYAKLCQQAACVWGVNRNKRPECMKLQQWYQQTSDQTDQFHHLTLLSCQSAVGQTTPSCHHDQCWAAAPPDTKKSSELPVISPGRREEGTICLQEVWGLHCCCDTEILQVKLLHTCPHIKTLPTNQPDWVCSRAAALWAESQRCFQPIMCSSSSFGKGGVRRAGRDGMEAPKSPPHIDHLAPVTLDADSSDRFVLLSTYFWPCSMSCFWAVSWIISLYCDVF